MTGFESIVILSVYALVGIIEIFFGYQLFGAVATITGALLGLSFGPEIYDRFIGATPVALSAAVGAFVGAVLFGVLALLGVWLAALLWGASLGFALGVTFALNPAWPVMLAVLLGGLAAAFPRPALPVLTGLHGAWLLSASAAALAAITPFHGIFPLTSEQLLFSSFPWLAAAAAGIGLLGAIFQLRRAALQDFRTGAPSRRRRRHASPTSSGATR